jgi:hypothetical protein
LKYKTKSIKNKLKFDEKRARTPSWVIRFTSKLQVKKIIDRRAETPHTFLEENHPMTISSKFVLIEQMVSDKKIFMGISHRDLC